MSIKPILTTSTLFSALALGMLCFTGCERKEKILDIETSRGEIEVERSVDTGEVDVDVNEN
jgi:hypothetical protein